MNNHFNFKKENTFIEKYENMEIEYSDDLKDSYLTKDEEVLNLQRHSKFLYHGLRYENDLEVLENIFKNGAILSRKQIGNSFRFEEYRARSNDDDHICLSDSFKRYKLPNFTYRTFVEPYISFVISRNCHAIKTIELPDEEFYKLENRSNLKQIYSTVSNEWQVKDRIGIEYFLALGLPYQYYKFTKTNAELRKMLINVMVLIEKYNIELPTVDTGFENELLNLRKLL